MTHFTIQIISDTICPWCYIGHLRLKSAISTHLRAHASDTFSTRFLPFYLNPHLPSPGIDKLQHYESKFGAQRTGAMQAHLGRVGRALGVEIKYGGRVGNTRDSHRLIEYAYRTGGEEQGDEAEKRQTKVVEALFRAYFEENRDVSDPGVLVDCAAKAGLDSQRVKEYLEGGEGGDEVDGMVEKAKGKFVSGVPHFTINGKYEVQGAEEEGVFLGIFERIKEEAGSTGTSREGVVQNENRNLTC